MTVWVECPNCGGKVEIPDAAPSDFPCPMCKYALLTSRPLERMRRLPSDSVPSWMRPWGYVFTIIGGLAFVAGAIGECFREPDPPMVAVIVAGLLNPIFFIGFPWVSTGFAEARNLIPLPPSPVTSQAVPYRVKSRNNHVQSTEQMMQCRLIIKKWDGRRLVLAYVLSLLVLSQVFILVALPRARASLPLQAKWLVRPSTL